MALLVPGRAQTGTAVEDLKDEQQMGASIYEGSKAKRQIVESSPLYDLLEPVGRDIVRAAQPRYGLPIRILLIHDAQPNAYAAPGAMYM